MKSIKKWLIGFIITISVIMSVIPTFAKEKASDWNGDINNPYEIINNNIPYFSESEKKRTDVFEKYSSLDSLGRCGVAYANICKEIMPTEEREGIGNIKPSGWQTPNPKYDFISGKYLYNRCHLIAFELAGENDNKKNLITGTRYLNINGMLPYENDIASYVKKKGNHVLYRVTPIFSGNNLVAEGVRMEGWSVEDNGKGICFNVFCYNVQPGVKINYANGKDEIISDNGSDENIDNIINKIKSGNEVESLDEKVSSRIKKTNNSNEKETGATILLIIIIIIWLLNSSKNKSLSKSSSKKKKK